MDVIGTLAAFASGDLQTLRYLAFTGSAVIPNSKFVIVFSTIHMIYASQNGMSGNFVNLVAPGGTCDIITSGSGSSQPFSFTGTKVTFSYNISIAYCPV